MSRYSEFFLNSSSNIAELETIEISHPSFSKVYRVVRNATAGVTVTLENGERHFFEYYPLNIKNNGSSDDLDQSLTITLGDLGETIPMELDRVVQQDKFDEKPILKYRTYRSDDLTRPLHGPIVLEIVPFSSNHEGSTFTAKAPSLNLSRTGEVYTLDRFPMLRGFL